MYQQMIFDRVAKHLLTQHHQSGKSLSGGNYMCMYRSPEGRKCAIGALIPDELYSPELEGKNVQEVEVTEVLLKARVVEPEDVVEVNGRAYLRDTPLAFLDALQSVHDKIRPENWRGALVLFARDHGLQNTVPKEPFTNC